jgi:ArsR family transcriptional regulator, arsenate/arsenite/antimonite-responsive transcriptional repressor
LWYRSSAIDDDSHVTEGLMRMTETRATYCAGNASSASAADDERIASVARALAHPARIRILRLLAEQTECRGADVFGELPLAQSTISEHLRVLKAAGLISSRPEGVSMLYCIVPGALDELGSAVGAIVSRAAGCNAGGC